VLRSAQAATEAEKAGDAVRRMGFLFVIAGLLCILAPTEIRSLVTVVCCGVLLVLVLETKVKR
jgi:hypothetical protein